MTCVVMNGDESSAQFGSDEGVEGKKMWCIHCVSLGGWRHSPPSSSSSSLSIVGWTRESIKWCWNLKTCQIWPRWMVRWCLWMWLLFFFLYHWSYTQERELHLYTGWHDDTNTLHKVDKTLPELHSGDDTCTVWSWRLVLCCESKWPCSRGAQSFFCTPPTPIPQSGPGSLKACGGEV